MRCSYVAAIGIAFFALVGQPALAQQPDADVLKQQFDAAYQAKNWRTAIEAGRKLANLRPDDPVSAYNLACVYALAGNKPEAMEWLSAADERGFADADLMQSDADLASLRELASFREVVERVGKRGDERFTEFTQRADKHEAPLYVPAGIDAAKPVGLIVALHGAGGKADEMIGVWKPLADARKLVLVAPQALERYGQGFFWGSPRETAYQVRRAIEQAAAKQKIDEQRIVLTGFSQGGYLAFALAARERERFCGVIPVAGAFSDALIPPAPASAPASAPAAEAKRPRYCILIGQEDNALDACRHAERALRGAGFAARLLEYPGVGHTFPPNRDAELAKALGFVLD